MIHDKVVTKCSTSIRTVFYAISRFAVVYSFFMTDISRFTPAFTTKNDLNRFHGYDERISVKNYVQVVEFYYRLIRNSDTKLETESEEEEEKEEKEGSGEMEMSGSGSGDEIYNSNGEDYEILADSEFGIN